MTTIAPRKKTPRKPLRIRPELLPDSAKYATIDSEEYVMIPVRDFGEWYEDVVDGAVAQYAFDNPEPLVPSEQVKKAAAMLDRRSDFDNALKTIKVAARRRPADRKR